MDFSAQLEDLQKRAAEAKASVQAAATESRDKLRQRIDQAQADANLAVKDAKQQAGEAADRARSKWAEMKADAAAKMGDVRQRSTSVTIRSTPRWRFRTRPTRKRRRWTPSTTPIGLSRMHDCRPSTRSTRVRTPRSAPRPLACRNGRCRKGWRQRSLRRQTIG